MAVKRLKTSSFDEFEKELRILHKLTPLPTPHLAKLLATYEIPRAPGNSRPAGKYYYFMSEMADSNLKDFWGSEPDSLGVSRGELARWAAQQCRGLAEGMKYIHNYRYELQSEPEGAPFPRHGFHGDIGPRNILVYRSWVGHENPLGVLQITDFGISSFHHTASMFDISRANDSHAYKPPESHVPFMRISQSHDIWTLGCLFLEFLTWLIKGPGALAEFYDSRKDPSASSSHGPATFYQMTSESEGTVISISEAVLKVNLSPLIVGYLKVI